MFDELLEAGRKNVQVYPDIDPQTPLTVCFTSGTTGNPKAAIQTH